VVGESVPPKSVVTTTPAPKPGSSPQAEPEAPTVGVGAVWAAAGAGPNRAASRGSRVASRHATTRAGERRLRAGGVIGGGASFELSAGCLYTGRRAGRDQRSVENRSSR